MSVELGQLKELYEKLKEKWEDLCNWRLYFRIICCKYFV